MLRSILAAALLAMNVTPADFTVCKTVDPGPIVKTTSPAPFSRKPDAAAMTEYPKTSVFDGMPPLRYRAPLKMIVETGSVAKCGVAGAGFIFEARTDGQIVHVPNPCDFPTEKFAVLLCHEQAHVEGWPPEHGA